MIQRRRWWWKGSESIGKASCETRKILLPVKAPELTSFEYLPERNSEKLMFLFCRLHDPSHSRNKDINAKDFKGSGWKLLFYWWRGRSMLWPPSDACSVRDREARELINFNSEIIWKSGAHTLVKPHARYAIKFLRKVIIWGLRCFIIHNILKRLIDERPPQKKIKGFGGGGGKNYFFRGPAGARGGGARPRDPPQTKV